jgi:hypothetical protein
MNDETGLLVSLWPVNHYRYMLLCGGAPEPEPTHSNFRERKKLVLYSCRVWCSRTGTEPNRRWLASPREGRHIAPSSTGSPFPTTTRGSSQFSSAPSRATPRSPCSLAEPTDSSLRLLLPPPINQTRKRSNFHATRALARSPCSSSAPDPPP